MNTKMYPLNLRLSVIAFFAFGLLLYSQGFEALQYLVTEQDDSLVDVRTYGFRPGVLIQQIFSISKLIPYLSTGFVAPYQLYKCCA